MRGLRIGDILIEQGILTERQVRHIQNVQRSVARPFGELAEHLYGLSPKVQDDPFMEQCLAATGAIDLDEIDINTSSLRVLSRRQAWQFHVMPIFRDENNLNLVTDSANFVRAMNFAAHQLIEPSYVMRAERHQLRRLLMRHYPVPQFLADFAEKL